MRIRVRQDHLDVQGASLLGWAAGLPDPGHLARDLEALGDCLPGLARTPRVAASTGARVSSVSDRGAAWVAAGQALARSAADLAASLTTSGRAYREVDAGWPQ